MTSEQFAEIKGRLLVKYKALENDCSQVCPSVLVGAVCYHANCEFKHTKACTSFPDCADLDYPRTHLPGLCQCDSDKASPEHLSEVPHLMNRKSLNEAYVIAWKLRLLERGGV